MGISAFIGVYLLVLLFVLGLSIVAYVLQALGYYAIASRRGIPGAALAWIPVGNAWILGSISDQYQMLVKGKQTKRRVAMLLLNAATMVVVLGYMIFYILFVVTMVTTDGTGDMAMGAFGVMMIIALLMSVLSIAMTIMNAFCLYDLYVSTKPDYAVLMLVLSLLVSGALPVCVFICRNSDAGMVIPNGEPVEAVEAETFQEVQ